MASYKVDLASIGIVSTCDVHIIHVKITDVNLRASEMIDLISDSNWIKTLGAVAQRSYSARAERTIEKLVNDILKKVDNTVSVEFGEFMISSTAQSALNENHSHTVIPLAELWKEKVIGNPAFDFHTESSTEFIAFGEAKYSGIINPYGKAIKQIADFIDINKDDAELVDLEHFVSRAAIDNALINEKAYVAAFSINNDPATTFTNALKSKAIKRILSCRELYLIGVEVSA